MSTRSDREQRASDAVVRAAMKWWRSRRPLAFSLEDHLENPTINTFDLQERSLARACAAIQKEKRRVR